MESTFSADAEFLRPANPWAPISDVAARLGVKPVDRETTTTGLLVEGRNSEWFDGWEVAGKFMDRMDETISRRDTDEARLLAEAYGIINILLNFTPTGVGSFHLEALVIARDRAGQFMAKVGKRDLQAGHPPKASK